MSRLRERLRVFDFARMVHSLRPTRGWMMDERAEMTTDRAMVRVGSAALLGLLNGENVEVEIRAQGEVAPGQREFFIMQLIDAVKAAYSDGYKVGYKAGYNDSEEYHIGADYRGS